MGIPFDRSLRPLRHGEFYAQWRLEQDVLRSARSGGALTVAVWAAIRARAGTRTRLEGPFAPSIGALAEDLGMSRRSVQVQVAALESAGMLFVDRPAGRKPVWILCPTDADPGTSCQGSPVENSDRPRHLLLGTLAPPARDPGTSCTPVPPQESRENRKNKSIGDDELRKTAKAPDNGSDPDELSTLVREFAGLMCELLVVAPGSPTVETLEELVEEAGDVEAWRALVNLARSATLLSPHLQAADA